MTKTSDITSILVSSLKKKMTVKSRKAARYDLKQDFLIQAFFEFINPHTFNMCSKADQILEEVLME